MPTIHGFRCWTCAAVLSLPLSVMAAASGGLSEDRGHVYRWNKFTDDLYALHLKQVADHEVRKETAVGGYAGNPGFYKQEEYFDAGSGRLLSVVLWEAANPDNIHSITVNRYDAQGRLLREYSSSYLPDYRNAPTQTLVFIHRYKEGVHAFRSFDATGDLLYERCEGRFKGEGVFISLDIDEIEEAMGERYQDNAGIMTEPAYVYCFGDMPDSASGVLPPR